MDDLARARSLEGLHSSLEAHARRWTRDDGEASELAQEALVRVLSSRIREESGLLPYGLRVMNNLARRRWRDAGRAGSVSHLGALEEASKLGLEESCSALQWNDEGISRVENRDLLGLIRERIARLPQPVREVCLAHWFRRMDYGEIANAFGIAEATARGRCHRARLMLLSDPEVREALGV